METDIKSMDAGEEKDELRMKLYNLTRPQICLKTREEKQLRLAREFLENLEMDPNQEEHGLEDIEEIAKLMPDYQFFVWCIEGYHPVASEVARFNPDGTKFIGLFYHNHHYEFVSHIKGSKASR
ncbi:hypothetical protein PAEPH01_2462 [Pancytospora epiphaga]|nr:hypothetical protein PAEPH01_2462 [Pancytospora epiphaga]